jgi:endonuclease YncB( thermonuclease family)
MKQTLRRVVMITLAIGLPSAPAVAEPIIGRSSVIDGDTLDIRGLRVRLHAVDAPESSQTCQDATGTRYRCGQKAALALSDRIGEANVSCEQKDQDRYGRIVAVCSARGEDLNAWLVRQGLALAYRQYGKDYITQEDEARIAKRGLWAGTFTPPWDYRRGELDPASVIPPPSVRSGSPAPTTAVDCKIKGNINSKGDRIYHMPGSRDYERTRLDTSAGERWFCSEEEALKAGWRAPRG